MVLSLGGFFHFERERFSLELFPPIALAVCVGWSSSVGSRDNLVTKSWVYRD